MSTNISKNHLTHVYVHCQGAFWSIDENEMSKIIKIIINYVIVKFVLQVFIVVSFLFQIRSKKWHKWVWVVYELYHKLINKNKSNKFSKLKRDYFQTHKNKQT